MTKFKKDFFFVFYLIAGIVLGALLAHLCADVPFLSWLAYHVSFGIDPETPFILDLSVLQLSFGLHIGIYVAQVLTIGISMFIYERSRIR